MSINTNNEAVGELPVTRQRLIILLIFCASPMAALVITAVTPALPALAAHLSHMADGAFVAQMVMTLPDASLVIGGLSAGFIIERFGDRAIIYIALLLYAAAGTLPLATDNIALILTSRFFLGFGAALFLAASLSVLARYFHGEQRKRLVGYKGGIAALVGFASFPAAGALVAETGWRGAFAIYTVAVPVLLLAIYVLPKQSAGVHQEENAKVSIVQLMPATAPLLLMLAASLLSSNTTVQGPLALASRGVDDPRTIGWIIAASALANSTSCFIYALFANRYSVRVLCATGFGLMASGSISFHLANTPIVWAFACASIGAGFGLLTPTLLNTIIERTAPVAHARAAGFFFSTIFMGQLLNPITFTSVREMSDPSAPFLVAAPLLIVVGMASLFLRNPDRVTSNQTDR